MSRRRRQWRQGRSGEDGDGQGVASKPWLGKGRWMRGGVCWYYGGGGLKESAAPATGFALFRVAGFYRRCGGSHLNLLLKKFV